MQIHLATDHAGFKLKEALKDYLTEKGNHIIDHGAFEYNENDDYPEYISKVAELISNNPDFFGIIFGGSGEGEAIDANRFPHVRAIEYYGGNLDVVKVGREHNNANILSLGARFVDEDEAKEAVDIFLNTPFSNEERHTRRIEEVDGIGL